MTIIQRATGMQDVLPEERRYWDMVIEAIVDLTGRYGFQRIELPILEYSELFLRGIGAGSDFYVQKEMYTIDEPGGMNLTLRPEFTAGFVRAYLQNGMQNWPQPVKLYTVGPSFRRERPQAGRFRQHSQFNAEILGEMDPAADLEVMMLAMNLYRSLGYERLTFQLNSTGCRECKPGYVAELKAYLSQHVERLADIDRLRLQTNALRVLDSKEPGMDDLLTAAPHIIDYLCQDCADHLAELRALLEEIGQSYTINFRLVRGIDYYTKTVFEVWAEGIGAQAAVCGGGRYDGLAEDIGGPPTPGVGFGSGIERIVLGMRAAGIQAPDREPAAVMVAHFGGTTKRAAVRQAFRLREAGVSARLAFARSRRSLKSQMREANKRSAQFVIILGESELEEGVATVRPLVGDEDQTRVPLAELVAWLRQRL